MTIERSLFFTLLFFAASLTVTHAQPMPQVISEHYTMAEGLPSNNVLCVLKDRDGFIWFGTWYGLCRFDGDRFVAYSTTMRPDSDIPPRKIESMAEDSKGTLWLKTVDWKLYTFDRRTERFHAVYGELKKHTRNLQVIKIQRTEEGDILLLTKDKTLLVGRTAADGTVNITKLTDARGKTDSQTMQLLEDVVADGQGYTVFIGRDYRLFTMPKGSRKALEDAMRKDEESRQQQTRMLQQRALSAGISKYAQLYLDCDSLLWVTTGADGVYCISTPKQLFSLITLPDNDQTGVRCIYQTRQGDIIVGTRSRNVYLYGTDGQLRQTLSYDQYGIGAVYHVLETDHGRLWLSTKGDGLVAVDSADWKHAVHYRHQADNPASISGNNVYMTCIDSQHHLWVGTLDGGLNLVREQNGQLTFYHKNNGFTHYPAYGLYTEVRNMVEDMKGRLWIGTLDGLMSLDTRFQQPGQIVFNTYHEAAGASFANNDIYTLYRDLQGQLWVGAFGGGLQRLETENENVQRSRTEPSVALQSRTEPSVALQSRTEPSVALQSTFHPLGVREGLRNDVIYSIVEDLHGHLWFATEAGLSCYNQQTSRIRNVDRYDGLPNVQMEEAAAFRCSDGRLWIGCKQGILTFDPEQLKTDKADYRTVIVDLVTDNQPYAGDTAITSLDRLELTHDQNAFTIEYAALNYLRRGSISYRYRLEGFDRDWRYSGPHRVASYNEVPPGTYTFIVETLDDANPTLHSAASMVIRILPPWWQTWWAWCVYLVIAVLIAWLVIRTVLQINRMRNEIYISQRLAKLTSKPDDGDEFIDRLHRIIRNNIGDSEFNIDSIALEMGLSRSAFFKKVKKQTGFAPVDLIKEFRLSHAAELLQTTTLSITEVAYKSGFRDPGYFGKCFRKRYGQSPREYIKNGEGCD